MEFRIYAEDPDGGFLPQAGSVRRFELPQGPGVRCDVGVRAGDTVPVHYDPLIGKIIVWDETRERTLARARRALDECVLEGIHSTLSFHRWLLEQEAFRTGRYDTATLAHEFRGVAHSSFERDDADAALLAALYAHVHAGAPRFPAAAPGGNGARIESRWRQGRSDLRPFERPTR
jgi:acetyl-CoA carboxylase biotin carboxylase subunit